MTLACFFKLNPSLGAGLTLKGRTFELEEFEVKFENEKKSKLFAEAENNLE